MEIVHEDNDCGDDEITSVTATACGAAADFYKLPSETSLTGGDIKMMPCLSIETQMCRSESPIAPPEEPKGEKSGNHNNNHSRCLCFQHQDSRQGSPPTQSTNTQNIEPAFDAMMMMMMDDDAYDVIKQDLRSRQHAGLHHPEGAAFPRDHGGFLLPPVQRRQNSTSNIIRLAHAIVSSKVTGHEEAVTYGSPPKDVTATFNTTEKDETDGKVEERVSLAPRFNQPQRDHYPLENFDWLRQHSFLSSRSASHDVVEEYSSPTSSADQDILRRTNPCPSMPLVEEKEVVLDGDEEPRGNSIFTALKCTPHFPPIPASTGATTIPHATLSRNTSAPPALPARRTSHGKAILCRSLAWSQDSQDDRRITKRARTSSMSIKYEGTAADVNSAAAFEVPSPFDHTDTFDNDESWASISSTSGMTGTGRVRLAYTQSSNVALTVNCVSSPRRLQKEFPTSSQATERNEMREEPSPTMVHWEEKVGDAQDLMTRVYRMHHSRTDLGNVASPASISAQQPTASLSISATTSMLPTLGLIELQQPQLNHSMAQLQIHQPPYQQRRLQPLL